MSEMSNEPGRNEGWERDLVNRLAFAALNEQRRTRRWNIFFRGMFVLWLFAVLMILVSAEGDGGIKGGKHTALVEVQGIIADGADASADNIVTGLRNAFDDKNTVGIVLRINSPGGSPVQAGYVYDEIRRLHELHPKIPVYAVVSDICASGGYYIAAAADKIYADKASVVGSIGVLMNGFGFVGTLDKLGVERRLLTAGEHKGFLDPFSPQKDADVTHIQKLLNNIHQQFITAVKTGRGERLKETPDLFSGLVWTGEESVALGLIDGLGSTGYVAREVVGEENIVDFTPRPHYFEKLAANLGSAMADRLGNAAGLNAGAIR